MTKLLLTVSLLGILGYAAWVTYGLLYPGPPPQLDPNEWWGPKETKERQDTSIRPFQVKFSEEMVTDLKARLKNYRPPVPPLNGVGFQYGFNSNQLSSWVKYWAEEYPFSDREKFLNQFPQYKTNIQGLDIHFIRVKPKVPAGVDVVPLLLMHGWPGSVREFFEAIPLLTQQKGFDFAFEVIVPSLPGYGFSDTAVRPGLGAAQVAVIFKNLMNRLGFKKFYIQGGDWGALVASIMSTAFPDVILGHHTNMAFVQNGCTMIRTIIGAFIPSLIVEPHLADRMYPLSEKFSFFIEEFGYMHLQATKPDTIGVSLTDSPAGLLTYILEKFSTWTRFNNRKLSDGGLSSSFTKAQLIDNLMIYWTSNSITTSLRLYAESMTNEHRALAYDKYPSSVPVWFLQAKNELFYQSPTVLKVKYSNIIGTTVVDDGGHFLAFQMPKVFAEDVFKAVQAFRSYHSRTLKTEL